MVKKVQKLEIKIDDLSGQEVANLLQEHIEDMQSISPPESKHALNLEGLRHPSITFWSVWDSDQLAGCGAIKELDATHAELKSMRTAASCKGRGIASMLLEFIIKESRSRGYRRLSLETGSKSYFDAAISLYQKHGFEYCAPFSSYKEDPHSVFMTKRL